MWPRHSEFDSRSHDNEKDARDFLNFLVTKGHTATLHRADVTWRPVDD